MKKTFYTELAYVFGIMIIALGGSLMVAANFGVSMVVAPAYLCYRKISLYLPWFTFGMAEYTFQAILLIFTIIFVRKFKVSYLFSFITAVYYGLCLDVWTLLIGLIKYEALWLQIVYFVVGFFVCAFGVALIFKTYIAPEVYELFVKETSKRYHWNINRLKTIFDITLLVLAICLSFIFFGWPNFVGIGWGTLVCALLNGFFIGQFSKLLNHFFVFKDRFKFRKFFEGESETQEGKETSNTENVIE